MISGVNSGDRFVDENETEWVVVNDVVSDDYVNLHNVFCNTIDGKGTGYFCFSPGCYMNELQSVRWTK